MDLEKELLQDKEDNPRLMFDHGWPSTQPGSLHTALQRKYTQPCSLFSRGTAVWTMGARLCEQWGTSTMGHGCVHPWFDATIWCSLCIHPFDTDICIKSSQIWINKTKLENCVDYSVITAIIDGADNIMDLSQHWFW